MPLASIEKLLKTLPLASALVAAGFLAGCGGGNAAHGGLVPEINGAKTLNAGQTATYDFGASSAHSYRLGYGVNWGDGTRPFYKSDVSSGSSVSADHAWTQPGTYTITATATDGHGESGFSTYSVQVTPAPPPDQN